MNDGVITKKRMDKIEDNLLKCELKPRYLAEGTPQAEHSVV